MDKKKKKTTDANDWLQMDLESQSGAIWVSNEGEKIQKKENIYKLSTPKPKILSPDPIKYGNVEIKDKPQIID